MARVKSSVSKEKVEQFLVQKAEFQEAGIITAVCSERIDDPLATLGTEHRHEYAIANLFYSDFSFAVVADRFKDLTAVVAGFPYRAKPRHCRFFGFSVHTCRQYLRPGCRLTIVEKLIEIARKRNVWKLVSAIFPENEDSGALYRAMGFQEVGTYNRHAMLDDRRGDVVIVEKLIDSDEIKNNG